MANRFGSALADFYAKMKERFSRGEVPTFGRRSITVGPNEHFLRASDYDRYSLLFGDLLPDPDEVLKKAGLTGSAYYQLMTDAHVAGCVQQRKSRTKRMNMVIQARDAKDPLQVKAADLIKEQFSKIDRLPEVVSEILDSPLYGATYLELFFNRLPISSERPNGEIVLLNIMAKPFEWFVWDEDGTLFAKDIDQANSFNTRDLPPNKFIACVNEGSYRNPYGERCFKRAFWPFMFKKGGLRFWTEFLEKYGMPFLHGKLDPKASDDDLNQLHNDLINMVRNGVVTSRGDANASEVSVVESSGKGASSDTYKAYKNAMNIELSKAILGETLTIENSESGSQNATETHLEVLESLQDDDKRLVERTLKKIARLIITLNMGEQVPEPSISLVDPKEIGKVAAERDAILSEKLGVQFSKKYVSTTYRIPEEEFEIVRPAVGTGVPAVQDSTSGASDTKTGAAADAASKASNAAGAKGGKNPAFGELDFGETFTVENGLDRYIDGVVQKMDFLSNDIQAEISAVLKAATTYEEALSGIATIQPKVDTETFARIFADALDVAYYLGEMASKEGKI